MKNFLFLLTAFIALTATQVRADECLYAGVFGGANWLDVSKSGHRNDSRGGAKADFDVGYLIGGSIGYRWCGGLRLEGEIAYRSNEIKNAHFRRIWSDSSSERVKLKGHSHVTTYMANVLYDWPFECSPFKVYVGGGIGYANSKFNAHKRRHKHCSGSSYYSCSTKGEPTETPALPTLPTPPALTSNENIAKGNEDGSSSDSHKHRCGKNHNGFAAQAIVGLGYNICDDFDITVEYRYLYVSRKHNDHGNNNAIAVGFQTGF